MIDVLSERTTSSFPLSIGTGIALEALFDPTTDRYDPPPEIPDRLNLSDYDSFWVNVQTLLRNLISSVEASKAIKISPVTLTSYLLKEMEIITSLFDKANSPMEVVYYMPSYNTAYKKQSSVNVRMRADTTPKQQTITHLVNSVGKNLTKDNRELGIVFSDSELAPKTKNRCLVLTHIPHDLLSASNFKSMALLESHTGRMKVNTEWNTKYNQVPQANMNILPFTRKLLCVFGDKYMYQPMDIGFRRAILEAGLKCKWNPTTSERKLIDDFSRVTKERMLVDVLNKI